MKIIEVAFSPQIVTHFGLLPFPANAQKIRRARFNYTTQKKQLQDASKKYVQKDPSIHRNAEYQKKNSNVVANYRQAHPEVNREKLWLGSSKLILRCPEKPWLGTSKLTLR